MRPWPWFATRLCGKRLPNRGDDPVLGRLVEIGMHRQADHVRGQPLAHRNAALDNRKMPIGFLAIERDRIVDRGGNAPRLEGLREIVAPARGEADRVLRPYRG